MRYILRLGNSCMIPSKRWSWRRDNMVIAPMFISIAHHCQLLLKVLVVFASVSQSAYLLSNRWVVLRRDRPIAIVSVIIYVSIICFVQKSSFVMLLLTLLKFHILLFSISLCSLINSGWIFCKYWAIYSSFLERGIFSARPWNIVSVRWLDDLWHAHICLLIPRQIFICYTLIRHCRVMIIKW